VRIAELLAAWNAFYTMIGSAAAALTGLTFVVIALASAKERTTSREGIAAFTTPTVVHFSSVLIIAGVMAAPFRAIAPIATLLALAGAFGMIYVMRVAKRARTMPSYQPDAEDWTWHVLLPMLAYAALVAGAIAIAVAPVRGLFVPATAVTVLIVIGIHNAWDVVTFLAVDEPDGATP
jgi:hypothetical protein